MSNPLVSEPEPDFLPEPEPDPDGEVVTDHSQDEDQGKDNKNYIVKTPWYIDSMNLGEGYDDIVVTPKGVELTGEQRQRAFEVAKESGVTLKSKEV